VAVAGLRRKVASRDVARRTAKAVDLRLHGDGAVDAAHALQLRVVHGVLQHGRLLLLLVLVHGRASVGLLQGVQDSVD
jgi:hypothetical protein